jgi:hypothetical protein
VIGGWDVLDDNGHPNSYIGRWTGSEWARIGGRNGGEVNALAAADLFGDGVRRLVAGGNFWWQSGGETYCNVVYWDGGDWRPLGETCIGVVNVIEVWDSDGSGPVPERLVVAGALNALGSLAVWENGTWRSLSEGFDGSVGFVAVFESGDDAAGATDLLVGGSFTTAGGVPALGLARWDGSAWHAFGKGINGSTNATLQWSDPSKPGSARLLVAGDFGNAGGRASTYFAQWGEVGAPAIDEHPADVEIDARDTAVFEVVASGGTDRSYQWRREGVDLTDGVTPFGSAIVGSETPTLTVSDVRTGDAGRFDCVVTNGCGPTTSRWARLDVVCVADFDRDGAVDTRDVVAFLNAWVGGDASADLNGDGHVDTRDVVAFLNLWTPGC